MILGIDVSTYFEVLESGSRFYENGVEVDPLDMFINNNVNYMRIRVWNNPFNEEGKPYLGGTNDVDTFIKLAKLAISKGYKILLDLHYSDFWADPGKQFLPKAWKNLSVKEVSNEIYEFTKFVLNRAKEENIHIDMIQIGNEITNGMCWPLAFLRHRRNKPRANYRNLASFLKSGLKASREVFPEIKTVIHLEKSYDQVIYQEFFDHMEKYNVQYDIIGASYYPYWHGSFDQLFDNLNMCRNRYNKEVAIMELGYGFTVEDYIFTNNGQSHILMGDDAGLSKPYPLTIEGQALFVEETLRRAKENNMFGVFYWEPCWIPGKNVCWASVEGQQYINEVGKDTRNEWANQCLFDYKGEKLPSFDKFRLD
jgi:arabinogalactan endo-1,4-beta-galactosidase